MCHKNHSHKILDRELRRWSFSLPRSAEGKETLFLGAYIIVSANTDEFVIRMYGSNKGIFKKSGYYARGVPMGAVQDFAKHVDECRPREVARDNNLRSYKGAQEIKIG